MLKVPIEEQEVGYNLEKGISFGTTELLSTLLLVLENFEQRHLTRSVPNIHRSNAF